MRQHLSKIFYLSALLLSPLHAGQALAYAPGIPEQSLKAGRVGQGKPALAPFAHVRFCMDHPAECHISPDSALPSLTQERWAMLGEVNRAVNAAIQSRPDKQGAAFDVWSIAPRFGDCDDYAVTKRSQLLRQGWPSQSLLLAHTRTRDGQEHLVLIVRSVQGDFVLDNLHSSIRPVERAPYDWVKVQSAQNPVLWHSVRGPSAANS